MKLAAWLTGMIFASLASYGAVQTAKDIISVSHFIQDATHSR